MPTAERRLVLTCEHAGNRVPRQYRPLFADSAALLASHRGWDPNARSVARSLASALAATLVTSTTTRLLVDLNRSPHNPAVFSELTRFLPRETRAQILARYHQPHWERVRAAIAHHRRAALHISVHSFTPVWKDEPRRFTVGILYDPKRPAERSFAVDWQRRLRAHLPRSEVRRNAPYSGDADGITTALRREFSTDRYLGIELELNQRALTDASQRRGLVSLLDDTLRPTIARQP